MVMIRYWGLNGRSGKKAHKAIPVVMGGSEIPDELGCIVFSQYFDSIWWLANQLSGDFPDEPVGIYAGGNNSGIILSGDYNKMSRDDLKQKTGKGELRRLL